MTENILKTDSLKDKDLFSDDLKYWTDKSPEKRISPVSDSGCLIGTSEEMRILHIKSLRGRYKNKLTPSEDFARKKAGEILLEG